MEKLLSELTKELNWKERIILKILKKYTYKVYGISAKNTINSMII